MINGLPHLRLFTGESAVVGFIVIFIVKQSENVSTRRAVNALPARGGLPIQVCGGCRCNATPRATLHRRHPSLFDDWYVCLLRLEREEAPGLSYRRGRPEGSATCLTLQPSFFE